MAVFFVPLKDLLAVLLMNMNVLKVVDSIPSLIEKTKGYLHHHAGYCWNTWYSDPI